MVETGDYLATGRVHIGDVRELAGRLEPRSVQTIVTSPPYYGLRSYLDADHPSKARELGGEETPAAFVANLVAVFAALRPALKDDGTIWLNLGDSYNGGGGYAPDAPSNRNGNDRNGGRSREFSSASRKGQVAYPQKCLLGIPWRMAFALIDDGWILRSDVIWNKPNPMPESVTDRPTRAHEYIFLLSKSPRYFYDADAIKEAYADGTADRIGQSSLDAQQGGYKTEAYQQDHPGKKARDRRPADILRAMRDNGQPGRNKRDVWTVTPAQFPGAHFATFAPDLIRPCVLAGTSAAGECVACGKAWVRCVEKGASSWETRKAAGDPMRYGDDGNGQHQGRRSLPDAAHRHYSGLGIPATATTTGWAPQCRCDAPTRPQVVLDPFMGSGTTGAVAFELGRHWQGFDLDERALKWTADRLARMPIGTLC